MFGDYIMRMIAIMAKALPLRRESMAPSLQVFLSYSSADVLVARRLARVLEQVEIRVFVDILRLRASHDLDYEIHRAINDCQVGVVLLSPSSLRSDWVRRELGLLNAKDASRVVLVRLGGLSMDEADEIVGNSWCMELGGRRLCDIPSINLSNEQCALQPILDVIRLLLGHDPRWIARARRVVVLLAVYFILMAVASPLIVYSIDVQFAWVGVGVGLVNSLIGAWLAMAYRWTRRSPHRGLRSGLLCLSVFLAYCVAASVWMLFSRGMQGVVLLAGILVVSLFGALVTIVAIGHREARREERIANMEWVDVAAE